MVNEKEKNKGGFKAVILGASGYAGSELVRLLSCHDFIETVALCGDKKAGLEYERVYPHLRHLNSPKLKKFDQVDFENIDIVKINSSTDNIEMAKSAPVDIDKVSAIKNAISKGNYPINLEKVADALLEAYKDIK